MDIQATEKTVYSFDPVTGRYLGETIADRSPLDDEEVWLIPAHATEIAPPAEKPGKVRVFANGKWSHVVDSTPLPVDDGPPTDAAYRAAVQALVDASARSHDYQDGATLASFEKSKVPEWKAEADAFIAWRDAVWIYVFAEFAKMQSEQRTRPPLGDFIDELPRLVWP